MYSLENVFNFLFPFLEAICTVWCLSTSKEIGIQFRTAWRSRDNNIGCLSGLKGFIIMLVMNMRKR